MHGLAWKLSIVMLVVIQSITSGCAARPNTGEGEALIGTWSCHSASHTVSTMQFSRASNGSITMSNRYTTKAGESGEFDETYTFDPKNQIWTWSTTDSLTASTEAGTAGPWNGRMWIFDGARTMQSGKRQNIQMIYTRLNRDAFRRDFSVARQGSSTTTSSSLCRRRT